MSYYHQDKNKNIKFRGIVWSPPKKKCGSHINKIGKTAAFGAGLGVHVRNMWAIPKPEP